MTTFDIQAQEFLAQEHIAVAGVSRKKQNAANLIYRTLRKSGHQVFAVNPHSEMLEGDKCYPNLKALPEDIGGLVVVTRPEMTEQIMRECVEVSMPRVWMHNNTFMPSSVSDDAVELGRQNGLVVISGGCPMMFLEIGHKCMRWVLGVTGRLPE